MESCNNGHLYSNNSTSQLEQGTIKQNTNQPPKKKKKTNSKKNTSNSKQNQSIQLSFQNADTSNSKTNYSKVKDDSRSLPTQNSEQIADKTPSPVEPKSSKTVENVSTAVDISLKVKMSKDKIDSDWSTVNKKSRGGGRGRGIPTVAVAGSVEQSVGGLQERPSVPIPQPVVEQKQFLISSKADEIPSKNQKKVEDERKKLIQSTLKFDTKTVEKSENKTESPTTPSNEGDNSQGGAKSKTSQLLTKPVSQNFEDSTRCKRCDADIPSQSGKANRLQGQNHGNSRGKNLSSYGESDRHEHDNRQNDRRSRRSSDKADGWCDDHLQDEAKPNISQHVAIPVADNSKGSSSDIPRKQNNINRLQGPNQGNWADKVRPFSEESSNYRRRENNQQNDNYRDFHRNERGRGRGEWGRGESSQQNDNYRDSHRNERGRGRGEWGRGESSQQNDNYRDSHRNERGRGRGEWGRGTQSNYKQFGPPPEVALRSADRLPEFIREVKGDLFICSVDYSLAHCVSADFEMGKGVAVEFKKRFKGVDELLDQGKKPGSVAFLKREDRYIYYLVTKSSYYKKPTMESLEKSLIDLRKLVTDQKVTKLAMPRIGSGLDRLDWNNVLDCIIRIFKDGDVNITVYVHNPKTH